MPSSVSTQGDTSAAPPSLTVVMPVYNALPYLDEAIASIVGQSYSAFRLAIYDDCSTDGSYEAIEAWAARDARISVTRGAERLGPTGSSNAAAALAITEFVARMDADDLMVCDRLEVQMRAMKHHRDAILIGSTFDLMAADGKPIWIAPRGRVGGSFPPIAHPTILYRKAAFDAVGGYRADTDYFEDRDLYLRMARYGEILVVNRPMIKVRFGGQHARLVDERELVLRKISRQEIEQKGGLTHARPMSPMAFYSIANPAMLALRRPGIFGLMMRKMSFARPIQALTVAGVIALMELSPRLARTLWKAAMAIRGMSEKRAKSHEQVYVWKPPHINQ